MFLFLWVQSTNIPLHMEIDILYTCTIHPVCKSGCHCYRIIQCTVLCPICIGNGKNVSLHGDLNIMNGIICFVWLTLRYSKCETGSIYIPIIYQREVADFTDKSRFPHP